MDQTGQDSYDILLTDIGENIRFFGVYDGHGIKGKYAANFIKDEIRKELILNQNNIQKFSEKKDVDKYFKKLYNKIQTKFYKNSIDFDLSGSCALSILIIKNKCYIINLGDSRAVIGRIQISPTPNTFVENMIFNVTQKVAFQMSSDHKPDRYDEKERIEKNGGCIRLDNEEVNQPYRVYSKNDDSPGLAVSRSLGDLLGHTIGVSNIPEISEKILDEMDSFIVIATNGVFNVMTSTEVVGFVFEKGEIYNEDNRQKIVEELVQECRYRWEQINVYKEKLFYENLENMVDGDKKKEVLKKNIDDITAVICFFSIKIDE